MIQVINIINVPEYLNKNQQLLGPFNLCCFLGLEERVVR